MEHISNETRQYFIDLRVKATTLKELFHLEMLKHRVETWTKTAELYEKYIQAFDKVEVRKGEKVLKETLNTYEKEIKALETEFLVLLKENE